jgi:hypothetical protein
MPVFAEFGTPVVALLVQSKVGTDAPQRKPMEEAKETWLEQAPEEGFSSGVYEGDAFADVRRELGLSTSGI